jgi:hypothetical protein
MSGTTTSSRRNRGVGSETDASVLHDLLVEHNKAIDDLETLRAGHASGVVSLLAAGLSVDANPEDVETDNAITIRYQGTEYDIAAQAAIDISTKTGGGNTIATSRADAIWVFANPAGLVDAQSSIAAQALTTTALGGLARYSVAALALPPTAVGAAMVPIGVVSVLEGGSGTFTIGTDSITTETEVYYSFKGRPAIVTPAASFAATGGATATFAYGAGICRLGTGTVVSYTGKTGVAFDADNKTSVTTGLTGAWLLYVLADDSEIATQIGGAGYSSLAAARAAVRAHNPNPLLPVIGAIYVTNASGADFVPATTNLNVAGLTSTFDIVAAGARFLDAGSDLTAAKIGDTSGVAILASS